jgi:hypothetical protein
MVCWDKHSSLLLKTVNHVRKKFYNTGPWPNPVDTFCRNLQQNGRNYSHNQKNLNSYLHKKFYRIGSWTPVEPFGLGSNGGQSYKDFYSRNLRMFGKSLCGCSWKAFPA